MFSFQIKNDGSAATPTTPEIISRTTNSSIMQRRSTTPALATVPTPTTPTPNLIQPKPVSGSILQPLLQQLKPPVCYTGATGPEGPSVVEVAIDDEGNMLMARSDGTIIQVQGKCQIIHGEYVPGPVGEKGEPGETIVASWIEPETHRLVFQTSGDTVFAAEGQIYAPTGATGKAAPVLESARIDSEGNLVLFLDNSAQIPVQGKVKGPTGCQGKPGAKITDGYVECTSNQKLLHFCLSDGSEFCVDMTSNLVTGPVGATGASIREIILDSAGRIRAEMSDGSVINARGRVVAPTGCTGAPGIGIEGKEGKEGKEGASIKSAQIDETGHLELEMSNGAVINVRGRVVCTGPPGIGIEGKEGREGATIRSAQVDETGHLELCLTNGTVINVRGRVVAPTGCTGSDGQDGRDGRDGVGIRSAAIDETGRLRFRMTDGRSMEAEGSIVVVAPTGCTGPRGRGEQGIQGETITKANIDQEGQMTLLMSDHSEISVQGRIVGPTGVGIVATELTPSGQLVCHLSDNSTITSSGTIIAPTGPEGRPGKPGLAGENAPHITDLFFDSNRLVLVLDDRKRIMSRGHIWSVTGCTGPVGIGERGHTGREGPVGRGVDMIYLDETVEGEPKLVFEMSDNTSYQFPYPKCQCLKP